MTPYILVAEDDLDSQLIMTTVLSRAGWQVKCASNGAEALSMVAEEHPALIVLDLMMPVLNGFETLSLLKRDPNTRDIPVIISSLLADDRRLTRLGATAVLLKGPAVMEQLMRTVGDILTV